MASGMRIVMTLLVRDEADIVDDQIAYHLAGGVDVVVATDHRSVDGTTEILERYEAEGKLHLIREEGEHIRQSEWVTRMARLAATEYEADWVVHSDADEFWWPHRGTLRDVLGCVPAEHGIVRGYLQNFVPRTGDGWYAERMTARLSLSVPINDPGSPWRPASQLVHRAHPEVVVGQGNHRIEQPLMTGLRSWYPLEILHFPFRTPEQTIRKHANTISGWERNLRGDLARARSLLERGRRTAFWDRVAVDDAVLERGLRDGSLEVDTRLRDALRAIRSRTAAETSSASLDTEAAYASEVLALADAEIVRFRRWLDDVGRRVDALEDR